VRFRVVAPLPQKLILGLPCGSGGVSPGGAALPHWAAPVGSPAPLGCPAPDGEQKLGARLGSKPYGKGLGVSADRAGANGGSVVGAVQRIVSGTVKR
jgi:hypothetical protein